MAGGIIVKKKDWSGAFSAAGGAGGNQRHGGDDSGKTGLGFTKEGQFFVNASGVVYQRTTDGDKIILAPETVTIPGIDAEKVATTPERKDRLLRLKLLSQMREAARGILDLQIAYSDREIAVMREAPWAQPQRDLARLYRVFTHKFGPINKVQIQRTGVANARGEQLTFKVRLNLREFREDPDAYLVASIENFNEITGEAQPGPIFSQRVLAPRVQAPLSVDTAREAMDHALGVRGDLDFPLMQSLLGGRSREDIIEELKEDESIFLNPLTQEWEPRDLYLSGDVAEKLAHARDVAMTDWRYSRNVQALEQALPRVLTPPDINVALGMHWIPPHFIKQFAEDVLKIENTTVHYINKVHMWRVYGDCADTVRAEHELGTAFFSALELLRASLNNRRVVVSRDQDDDGNQVDKDLQTEIAQGQQKKIESAFQDWVWGDAERQAEICWIYNKKFNSVVPRKYDGRHLAMSGASLAIKPRPHQKDAAWRNIQNGNTLYAHEVGAGKTFASIIACVEKRRMGHFEKPCFVVPNHMLAQFSRDFMRLYPNAHLLVLEDDQFRENGKKVNVDDKLKAFARRAAAHPWDAVFMTQSNFDRLNTTPRVALQMLLEEIRELNDLASAPAYQDHDSTVSYLRGLLENKQSDLVHMLMPHGSGEPLTRDDSLALWQNHFEKIVAHDADDKVWDKYLRKAADAGPYFEDTGIDYLFVDEGQDYKNLEVASRIEGFARAGSARAENLRQKLFYLDRKHPGDCLSLMTATPVSNAISEIYTMQRYMQPALLKQYGVESFDAWVAMFGDYVTGIEMAPEGETYRVVSRIAQYKNVPELMRMFHSFADIILGDMLDLPLPDLKDGGHQIVKVPRTSVLEGFFQDLARRADDVRNKRVSPRVDNMLKITMEGRKATLHPALVGLYPVRPELGKVEYLAQEVATRYFAHKDRVYTNDMDEPDGMPGALQMVFCDMGIPKGEIKFSVYEEIRRNLVAQGVPEHKIRFVHDYDGDQKKADLFEQCRQGHVSVLVGTTPKLGTGTNVQKRLVAEHHLDPAWRPSDIIQRDGRILRQGNQNPEVEILRYVMEKSYDVFMWQTLERKIRFISQVMRGDYSVRNLEEIDEAILSYTEVKAAATGDPLILEKAEIDHEMINLERLKIAHDHEIRRAKFGIKETQAQIRKIKKDIARTSAVTGVMKDDPALSYPLMLDGRTFVDAAMAGDFLKRYLRDLRKDLRAAKTGQVERPLGSVYGIPVTLRAQVTIGLPEEIEPGRTDKTPRRDYKYKFTLAIDDPEKTEILIRNQDIRELAQERETRKDNDVVEVFQAAAQTAEQVLHSNRLVAERLVAPYRELREDLAASQESLQEMQDRVTRLQAIVKTPFHLQDRYEDLAKQVAAINKTLLSRPAAGTGTPMPVPAPA